MQGKVRKSKTIREIHEELNLTLKAEELSFFAHISAPAYGEDNLLMEQDCFLVHLNETIHPSAEIEAIKYFSLEEYKRENIQVAGVLIAFAELEKQELI